MRKAILISMLCLFAMVANGQEVNRNKFHFKNVYKTIDTLVIANIPTVSPTKDGDYLISLPKEENLIVAYNKDRSKAIVLHGYMWGKHMEFDVKYEEHRVIFSFKDKHLFCGYIYDERVKACKYFEAINENEKDRLVSKFPFLKRMPTFVDK